MRIFNSIKKSRRASSDIDEKIEYLNKELEKTGLREAMLTTNIYVSGERVPNQAYNDFNGLSQGGYALGLSADEGDSLGGAMIGVNPSTGQTDVALSPPHPVFGNRRTASTVMDGVGSNRALRPGKGTRVRGTNDDGSPRVIKDGSAVWFWDGNYNSGEGRWLNFEWLDGELGFWDTNFLGFFFHNTNLDDYELSGVNIGTQIKNKIAGINFGANGSVGTPQTLVLQKNDLGDPSFLPINIDGLSPQGFDYLKDKAIPVAGAYSGMYDLDGRGWFVTGEQLLKMQKNPEKFNLTPAMIRRIRRMQVSIPDDTKFASTDLSSLFPSSEPDKFPIDPPLDVPDKPPTPIESDPYSDGKKDSSGLDATAIKAGYNDPYFPVNPDGHYTALVTSAQDILSAEMEAEFYGALSRGESPNYDNASINNAKEKVKQARASLDNWERWKKENNYVWIGPTNVSGEPTSEPSTDPDADGEPTSEPSTDSDADGSQAQPYDPFANELKPDLGAGDGDKVAFFGKKPPNPNEKQGRGSHINIINYYQSDGMMGTKPEGWTDQDIQNYINKFYLNQQSSNTNTNTDSLLAASPTYTTDDMKNVINYHQKKKLDPNYQPKSYELDSLRRQMRVQRNQGSMVAHYQSKGKVLSEGAKLGHFEPEQLNVNIEDLRKGIMPEFPKDPPPEMVNGYNPKSRLAPKKLERSSFIKITKKDLAKNHKLKDSEIKDFMDTINAVNDFIKKHPEELIYAQTRYPKNDPRLAQLNWEMDQKLNASKEYMDKHYPENQKLFTKVQKSIKKNIELTDPKSFKGVKVPKFKGVDLTDFKRRREVVARHFKKAVKTKKIFAKKKT